MASQGEGTTILDPNASNPYLGYDDLQLPVFPDRTPMKDHQYFGNVLQEHRELVAAFTTVQCSMQHETVTCIRNTETGTECERKDLCPREFRNRQLACGHTTSRNSLRIAVEDMRAARQYLHSQKQTPAIDSAIRSSTLLTRIEQLNSAIGRLDHAKGDTELHYALARDAYDRGEEDSGIRIEELKDRRTQIHERHAEFIIQMEELRGDILTALDSTLAQLRSDIPTP